VTLNNRRTVFGTKATLTGIFCLLFAACAKPTGEANQSTSARGNEPPQIASTDVVEVRPEELTLAKGESGYAIVRLQIRNGYHVNANPPTYPYLKATELELTPANGISVDFVSYPDALTKKFEFAEEPLKVYEGETIVKAMLKASPAAETGRHNLSGKLRVQACDDTVCYAPGVMDLSVPVSVK
jgi:thioredoxin:protein disulfide reductase